MARSSVPASSFRVSRPGRKRPTIAACFPAQRLSSDVEESTSFATSSSAPSSAPFPSLPRSVTSHHREVDTAAHNKISSPADGGSVEPSQEDESSLLESSCVSSVPEDSTADTSLGLMNETSSEIKSHRFETSCETETTNKLGHSLLESHEAATTHDSSASPTVPAANSFPLSAFRSPVFFPILRRYLPLTVSRLQRCDDESVAEESRKTPRDWLDEPDDVTNLSLPLETDGSCGFSKTEPHTPLKICSRDCSSSEAMDVEAVLLAERSLSTHSPPPATSLETNHLPEEQSPGTPPKKHKKAARSAFESTAKRGGKKAAESVDKAEATKRPSPNAFVSLRVSSPSIRCGLEEVQTAMVEKDKAVKSVLTSLDKLHVTLSVIRLENKEEEGRYI